MAAMKDGRYIETVGRRKTSVARARITPGAKTTTVAVNTKSLDDYFPTETMRKSVLAALSHEGVEEKFSATVHVTGGGINSQSEAIRHALARALEKFDTVLRKPLKEAGYLTRDPRMKERRKFGLRKARRAPQFSKR